MRRVAIPVLLVVVSTCLTAVVMEVGLRLVCPLSESGLEIRTYRQDIPGLKRTVTVRTEFGVRSASLRTREKPARTLRVLCLGASTTEQGNQNIEDTWSGMLERRLQAEFPGLQIEVAAWGRGGRAIGQAQLFMRNKLPALDPDVVVTLFGINDLCWGNGATISPASMPPPSPSWLANLQLVRRVRLASDGLETLRLLAQGRALNWDSAHVPALREHYRRLPFVATIERSPDPFFAFDRTLAEMLSELTAQKRAVLVLGQPVLWKTSPSAAEENTFWFSVATPDGPKRAPAAWMLAEMRRYNEAQQRRSAEFGARYLDLDAAVPKDLAHYIDDCHFTDAGSRTVADAVYPTLRDIVAGRLAATGRL